MVSVAMQSERILIRQFGGPNVLQLGTVELPSVPRPGQVRVRVAAAGVAFGDVMRRKGAPGLAPKPPFTPGYDIAGRVQALGNGVPLRWSGKRVGVLLPTIGIGGYARHVDVPADRLVAIPDPVPDDEAVCLALNYITACQLLFRLASLSAGDRVLVHGASGGVGTALLQLAADAGIKAYGTASAAKHPMVEQLGGIPIDYRNEDFVARLSTEEPEGVRAVFDGVGGSNLMRSYEVLDPRGTLVVYGLSGDDGLRGAASTAGNMLRLKLRLDRRKVRFYGISVTPAANWRACRDDYARLLAMRLEERVAPVVAQRIPLADASAAHALLEGGGVTGKVVLTC